MTLSLEFSVGRVLLNRLLGPGTCRTEQLFHFRGLLCSQEAPSQSAQGGFVCRAQGQPQGCSSTRAPGQRDEL